MADNGSLTSRSSYLKYLLYYFLLVYLLQLLVIFSYSITNFQHAALITKYFAKTPEFMTLKNTGRIYSQSFPIDIPPHLRCAFAGLKRQEEMLTFTFMDLHTARFHYKLHCAARNNAGEDRAPRTARLS